ncbi:ABC transporter ATP-binding protein [soil metagenome]
MTANDMTSATDEPLLEARDIAVHYGGIKAVDGVTISLTPGKIFGILGPNGSGKSTLLAAVTRLTPLTRGELVFDGRPYQTTSAHNVARRRIARTFQTVRLLNSRTVYDNIVLATDVPAIGSRPSIAERRANVDEAIILSGIGDFVSYYPDELSYGAQRRVEIARALASKPRLLLLDEPTAGMNRHEREEIGGLLQELRSGGLTQLLIEHDVQMMVDTCDYLYAMNSGVLIAQGLPREVVRNPAVQEAYLGKRWSQSHA